MIYSLEDKNKKELIVIVKHQIEEYQELCQYTERMESLVDMIVDSESCEKTLIPMMYPCWLDIAKRLKGVSHD